MVPLLLYCRAYPGEKVVPWAKAARGWVGEALAHLGAQYIQLPETAHFCGDSRIFAIEIKCFLALVGSLGDPTTMPWGGGRIFLP